MKTIIYKRGAPLKEGTGDHYFIKISQIEHEYVMHRLQKIIEIDLEVQNNPHDFTVKEVNEWQDWAQGHCTRGRQGPQTNRDYIYGTFEQHILRPDKDFSTRQIPHLEAILNRWCSTKIEFKSEFKYQVDKGKTWDRFFTGASLT